ncbi:MAG: PQQ-binding-like beta-propeller repeat protein [Deltaproteobacteria bacterium]|nr:PQQ-binding-like beta-propeller repeat protein [Deltaproteobacteria bacterium]
MYRENAQEDRSVLVVSLNGRVVGFDASSGERRWQYDNGDRQPGPDVLVHAGRVYVLAMTKGLTVLDYLTGEQQAKTDALGTYGGARPTMLVEGERLFVTAGAEVFCFDLVANLLWHDRMKGMGISSVTLAFPDSIRHADHGRR